MAITSDDFRGLESYFRQYDEPTGPHRPDLSLLAGIGLALIGIKGELEMARQDRESAKSQVQGSKMPEPAPKPPPR